MGKYKCEVKQNKTSEERGERQRPARALLIAISQIWKNEARGKGWNEANYAETTSQHMQAKLAGGRKSRISIT